MPVELSAPTLAKILELIPPGGLLLLLCIAWLVWTIRDSKTVAVIDQFFAELLRQKLLKEPKPNKTPRIPIVKSIISLVGLLILFYVTAWFAYTTPRTEYLFKGGGSIKKVNNSLQILNPDGSVHSTFGFGHNPE